MGGHGPVPPIGYATECNRKLGFSSGDSGILRKKLGHRTKGIAIFWSKNVDLRAK